jgi:glyoxylase-like metal-dependent hydrolase (beta-lactamase superfamily II)
MYELVQVGKNTFFIESPAKMGVYRCSENEVLLIDSGNDKDAGRKIQGILSANHWQCKYILNTHSNADHIGGNAVLQQRLNIPIYTNDLEACFNRFPILEPSFLYGGFPAKALRNKFLMAQPSEAASLDSIHLPEGFRVLPLPGHFFGMVGFKTPDEVWFLADSLMGENILNKYQFSFIYDVAAYLDTLSVVENLQGICFIPSHSSACEDIRPLVAANRAKVNEIIEKILEITRSNAMMTDEIIKVLFDRYQLVLNWDQYVLVGSTIRSYLSYLLDIGKVEAEFVENRLLWRNKS